MNEIGFLMTQSTHFIYENMTLDHVMKNHPDNESSRALTPLNFPSSNNGLFINPTPQTDSTVYTTAFVISFVEHLFGAVGARCSSVVRAFAHGAMGRRIDPSCVGPIELFLIPVSAPRLV